MGALTLFQGAKLPEHIRRLQEEEGSNIPDKQTVPSLSYGGKIWSVSVDGDKKKLMKKDADGDEVPASVVQVVVLSFNPRRGRAYYEGAYDPDNVSQPKCWSEDGFKPHESVTEPQSKKCETCPMSAKGSKVTDSGKTVSACSQHRMLAVVPAYNIMNPDLKALRLKIAITSDWDKQGKEQQAKGWFGFQQLVDYLKANGCTNTLSVVLKIKFDPNTDYPKLLFSPSRYTTDEEVQVLRKLAKTEEVTHLLKGWTPNGADGTPLGDDETSDQPEPKAAKTAKPAPEKAAPPKAKPALEDDDDEDFTPPPKAAKAKPKAIEDDDDEDMPDLPAALDRRKTKPKVVEVDDEDEDVIPPSKASPAADKAKPVKAGKPKTTKDDDEDQESTDSDVPDDVADILGSWGDD